MCDQDIGKAIAVLVKGSREHVDGVRPKEGICAEYALSHRQGCVYVFV